MAIVEREAVMRRAGMLARMARLVRLVLVAPLTACSAPFQPTATPITSTGDPSSAVPFHWTLQPEAGGGLLRVQGGNLHAITDEVRVVDAAGKTVASTPTTLLGANDAGLCGSPQAQRMVGAELRLPGASKWPDQYRLEAKVGSALSGMVNQVTYGSLRQAITPHHLLGRMTGSMRFIAWSITLLAGLTTGYLGGTIGLRATLGVEAAVALLAPLVVWRSPLRKLRQHPQPGE